MGTPRPLNRACEACVKFLPVMLKCWFDVPARKDDGVMPMITGAVAGSGELIVNVAAFEAKPVGCATVIAANPGRNK